MVGRAWQTFVSYVIEPHHTVVTVAACTVTSYPSTECSSHFPKRTASQARLCTFTNCVGTKAYHKTRVFTTGLVTSAAAAVLTKHFGHSQNAEQEAARCCSCPRLSGCCLREHGGTFVHWSYCAPSVPGYEMLYSLSCSVSPFCSLPAPRRRSQFAALFISVSSP